MPKYCSALRAPWAGEGGGAGLFVHDVVGLDISSWSSLASISLTRRGVRAGGEAVGLLIQVGGFVSPAPEMMRGVRASSIRMESTSSTMA